MNDRTAKRLLDALQACRQLVMLMNDVGREQFRSDAVLRLACERLLEIVGEALNAADREHPDLFRLVPDTPHAIAMRHKLIHGYDHISDEAVWDTITHDIPLLLTQLERAMEDAPPLD